MDLRLDRPAGLDQSLWAAVSAHLDRLRLALQQGDQMLAVGSANELVESIARVVLFARGEVAGAGEDSQGWRLWGTTGAQATEETAVDAPTLALAGPPRSPSDSATSRANGLSNYCKVGCQGTCDAGCTRSRWPSSPSCT